MLVLFRLQQLHIWLHHIFFLKLIYNLVILKKSPYYFLTLARPKKKKIISITSVRLFNCLTAPNRLYPKQKTASRFLPPNLWIDYQEYNRNVMYSL